MQIYIMSSTYPIYVLFTIFLYINVECCHKKIAMVEEDFPFATSFFYVDTMVHIY